MLKLYPQSLVGAIQSASEQEIAHLADRPLLLVRLKETDGKLAKGLEMTASTNGIATFSVQETPSTARQLFDRFQPEETVTRANPTLGVGKKVPLPKRSRNPASFGTATLEQQLTEAPHFGLPLVKRERGSESSLRSALALDRRIRVGRSKDSDILLNHASVSSAHAVIDAEHEGIFFVITDIGSTNGTKVNGEVLPPKKPVGVYPGDVVNFGDVETTVCPLSTLRQVLIRAAMMWPMF